VTALDLASGLRRIRSTDLASGPTGRTKAKAGETVLTDSPPSERISTKGCRRCVPDGAEDRRSRCATARYIRQPLNDIVLYIRFRQAGSHLIRNHRHGLQTLEKELPVLEKKSADLASKWQAEKGKLLDAQKMKSELEQLRTELANAQRKGEFQKAGELAYGRIPEIEKMLAAVEATESTSISETVTADNIAQVVSRWTGVMSVAKITSKLHSP
jgi:hypothetical protein